MPKKTFTPEQIVGKLLQIEMLVSQGKRLPLLGIVGDPFFTLCGIGPGRGFVCAN